MLFRSALGSVESKVALTFPPRQSAFIFFSFFPRPGFRDTGDKTRPGSLGRLEGRHWEQR